MYSFFEMIIIDCLSVEIISIPLLYFITRKNKNDLRKLGLIIFMTYIIAVYSVTGVPALPYINFSLDINIVPFIDIMNAPMSAILNIILFIPFGIMVPLLWNQDFHDMFKVVVSSFLFSLSIELLQVLTFRLTDINDLITNTLGSLIGYLIFRFIFYNKKIVNLLNKDDDHIDLYQMIIGTYIIMFFMNIYISSIIWNIL